MHGQRYTNGVLTAIAALLGLNFVGQMVDRKADLAVGVSTASAGQPEQYRRDGAAARPEGHMDPTEGGMISAAEQRKMIISELRSLGARMAAIDARLGTGLNVVVKEMPAMNWPSEPAPAAPVTAAPAPAPAAAP